MASYVYWAPTATPSPDSTYQPPPTSQPNFPSRWTIYPAASDPAVIATCPAPRDTFIGFIIANAVVTVLGVIIGCRPVLNKLFCNLLAKKGKKNTILYNWIPPVVLQILANVACGIIVHNTPGYEHVRIEDVMMLYLIRPRISLIATSTAAAFVVLKDEYPWMYSMLAGAITEFVLQLMAACWVAATGGFSAWDGSSFVAIAVFMFVGLGMTAIVTGMIVFMSRPYDSTGGKVFAGDALARDGWHGLSISNSFGNRSWNWLQLMFFACPAYIVSWVFFGLLISGAGDRWCPPKLGTQIVIWTVFPILGIFGGVGVS